MNGEMLGIPFVLLGVPYRVEVVEMPDPYDVDCVRYIERPSGVIRLQAGATETFLKRMLFGAVSREAVQLLGDGRDIDLDAESAFAHTYYGVLRRNPQVLSFCAGQSDEVPDGAEVAGVDWTINLVDFCPGRSRGTFGYAVYREQTIYLLRDLNLPLMRQVLLHELGHAVAEVAAPVLVEDEAFLRAYHVTLFMALRDNKEWVRYLFA